MLAARGFRVCVSGRDVYTGRWRAALSVGRFSRCGRHRYARDSGFPERHATISPRRNGSAAANRRHDYAFTADLPGTRISGQRSASFAGDGANEGFGERSNRKVFGRTYAVTRPRLGNARRHRASAVNFPSMTRRYRATTFSIAVAGALAIAACSTDDGGDARISTEVTLYRFDH